MSVNFLDVTTDLNEGHISTKTCTKSTDTHTFLSYNSFHPRHIKQSIIYSQFQSYRRNCCNDEMSLVNIVHLRVFFLKYNLIIHHYYTYLDAFTLVHLYAFEFASMDLTLVRFTLTKGTEVLENYVLDLCL